VTKSTGRGPCAFYRLRNKLQRAQAKQCVKEMTWLGGGTANMQDLAKCAGRVTRSTPMALAHGCSVFVPYGGRVLNLAGVAEFA
jgi:hypothetical protein